MVGEQIRRRCSGPGRQATVQGRGFLLGLRAGPAGRRRAAGTLRAPDSHRHVHRSGGAAPDAAALLLPGRSRPCWSTRCAGADMRKRDFLAIEDFAPMRSRRCSIWRPGSSAARSLGGLERKILAAGVHGPESPDPRQPRGGDVPARRARDRAGAGQGQLDLETEPGRGDGRHRGGAHRSRPPGCWPATPTRSGCGSFPGAPTGQMERQDRVIKNFAALQREAGDQPGVGPPPPVPGAGRRAHPQEKLGDPQGKRFVLILGLAPQGRCRRRSRPARRSPPPSWAWRW